MIHGIGTDIVRVARIQAVFQRFGDRFVRRILTDDELAEFARAGRPVHFLARRFAAKEAAAKALGTGFRDGLQFRHIGVVHDARGRPLLAFYGPARALTQGLGIGTGHLSLADEEDYAIAFVTLLQGPSGP
ncbi:MAG TPA: holo-ACP synthase [Gammaproteobacteria bacterium]|nr:holo-ACP synthase [Gammaproteobacteria bacterium]